MKLLRSLTCVGMACAVVFGVTFMPLQARAYTCHFDNLSSYLKLAEDDYLFPASADDAASIFEHFDEHRARMSERIRSLPPEQQEKARARMQEMQQEREQIRQELQALDPSERPARMEEIRQEMEQRKQERRQRYKKHFEERWENATTEERASFCEAAKSRCGDGGARACSMVSDKCE